MEKKYIISNINNLYLTNKNEWLNDIMLSRTFDSIELIDLFINRNPEFFKNNNLLEIKIIFVRK